MSDYEHKFMPINGETRYSQGERFIESLVRAFAYTWYQLGQDCARVPKAKNFLESHRQEFRTTMTNTLKTILRSDYAVNAFGGAAISQFRGVNEILDYACECVDRDEVWSYAARRSSTPKDSYEPEVRALLTSLPDLLRNPYRSFIRIVFTTMQWPDYYNMNQTVSILAFNRNYTASILADYKSISGYAPNINRELADIQVDNSKFENDNNAEIDNVVEVATDKFVSTLASVCRY